MSSTEEILKKRIAELEQQLQDKKNDSTDEELDAFLSKVDTRRRKHAAVPLMKLRK